MRAQRLLRPHFTLRHLSIKNLSVIFAFLVFACGCAAKHGPAKPTVSLGKIIIKYEFTERDLAKQPTAFDVYRSASANGPFEKVNTEPVKSDKAEIGKLQDLLADTNIPLNDVRYYYINTIDGQGRSAKATSVAAARAILPMDDSSHPREFKSTTVAKKRK